MTDYRKKISVALCCIGSALLLVALVLVVRQFIDDRHSQNTVKQLQDAAEDHNREHTDSAPVVTEEPVSTSHAPESTPTPIPTPEVSLPAPVENPYRDSFLANEDMAAWLKISDTIIDYPVMWTPGDENYYLYRAFDKSHNNNGCLILDTDSSVDPLSTNLIIHGHNMKSGAMFGTLLKYEDEAYYQEHKYITLYTKERQRNYEVIAVFRSQVYKKSQTVFKFYKFFQADTQEEFDDFYDNIMALSIYDTNVTAEFGDHFLTLSTCAYHVDRGRFVVVAKEIESGDSYLPLQEDNADTIEE